MRKRISAAEIQKIFIESFCPQRTQRRGEINVLGFILGSIFGGTVGVFTMCLCMAAGQAEKCENHTDSKD